MLRYLLTENLNMPTSTEYKDKVRTNIETRENNAVFMNKAEEWEK